MLSPDSEPNTGLISYDLPERVLSIQEVRARTAPALGILSGIESKLRSEVGLPRVFSLYPVVEDTGWLLPTRTEDQFIIRRSGLSINHDGDQRRFAIIRQMMRNATSIPFNPSSTGNLIDTSSFVMIFDMPGEVLRELYFTRNIDAFSMSGQAAKPYPSEKIGPKADISLEQSDAMFVLERSLTQITGSKLRQLGGFVADLFNDI